MNLSDQNGNIVSIAPDTRYYVSFVIPTLTGGNPDPFYVMRNGVEKKMVIEELEIILTGKTVDNVNSIDIERFTCTSFAASTSPELGHQDSSKDTLNINGASFNAAEGLAVTGMGNNVVLSKLLGANPFGTYSYKLKNIVLNSGECLGMFARDTVSGETSFSFRITVAEYALDQELSLAGLR